MNKWPELGKSVDKEDKTFIDNESELDLNAYNGLNRRKRSENEEPNVATAPDDTPAVTTKVTPKLTTKRPSRPKILAKNVKKLPVIKNRNLAQLIEKIRKFNETDHPSHPNHPNHAEYEKKVKAFADALHESFEKLVEPLRKAQQRLNETQSKSLL